MSEICLPFSRKQQQIFYHMMLTISYSESANLITLVEPLKASLYDYFMIWFILFILYSYKQ